MQHFSIRGPWTCCLSALLGLAATGGAALGQTSQPDTSGKATTPAPAPGAPARPARLAVSSEQSKQLRGPYGLYRANNHLLYYHLDVRVDPEKKTIAGKNTIRFKMLEDGSRIQIDLRDILNVDKILLDKTELKFERQADSVFIDFPKTLKSGQT